MSNFLRSTFCLSSENFCCGFARLPLATFISFWTLKFAQFWLLLYENILRSAPKLYRCKACFGSMMRKQPYNVSSNPHFTYLMQTPRPSRLAAHHLLPLSFVLQLGKIGTFPFSPTSKAQGPSELLVAVYWI